MPIKPVHVYVNDIYILKIDDSLLRSVVVLKPVKYCNNLTVLKHINSIITI